MANCLRKNLRSCGSFALVGRRNQQTNCFDQKTTSAITPFLKEMVNCDYSPLTVPHNYSRSQKAIANLQISSDRIFHVKETVLNQHSKDFLVDWENNTKLYCLRLEHQTVFCAKECKAYKDNQKESDNTSGRPNQEQLNHISNVLAEDLPKLFTKQMNYKIYHPYLIFENNIRGTKTVGLFGYVKEIAVMKLVGYIKFANMKFQILKITAHPEDGTVRVRWRITGISNYKALFFFIKKKHLNLEADAEGWYDGFSIFYVRSDGLVHKHTVDKMMPDSEEKISNIRNNLATKIAFAVGIMLKDFSLASISLEEIQEKHPNLLEVAHPSQKLESFSMKTNTSNMQIYSSVLVNKTSQKI